ncbi:MAG TPA: IS1634 family transposase [Tichowtungia sp.]|nr:IS1634 family transposase [Tichowtungia sp.]
MFFREKKSGSTRLLQLVENHRNAEGNVRQRVVASLGGCPVPDEVRKRVAAEMTHRMAGYQRLLSEEPIVEYWVDRVWERIAEAGRLPHSMRHEVCNKALPHSLCVDPDRIGHENGVRLGPSLVLLQAWQSLDLDQVLDEQGFSTEQIATAKAVVLNRLIDPASEHELPNWLETTALGDLLGFHAEGWAEDRFYRINDKLLAALPVIEPHLRNKERDLFNLDRTLLLFDLTNSYFEGTAAKNDLARRSVASKEKRSDCPLISVGVVLDAEGFIIRHKVFAGNISDCKTLLEAVAGLEETGGSSKPVVIVDGGMATDQNLQTLRERGYEYIVNGKRQTRAAFAAEFMEQDAFRRVDGRGAADEKRPVFVRCIESGNETIVLCRSAGRRDKENAIVDGAERKLIEGLEKLHARILRNDPRLKLDQGSALVDRAIGRLAARTTRASKLYEIEYDHKHRLLSWERQEQWDENRELHGCYHLRSTLDLEDRQLWKLYITLTRVEDAFRSMKSELGLHPFHHQLARRCRAHIWITILAYHLLRWTEHSLKLSGYDCTWRTLRRRLDTHCYATLILEDDTGLEIHLRKAGRPNSVQKLIYALLGINWRTLPSSRRIYQNGECAKT